MMRSTTLRRMMMSPVGMIDGYDDDKMTVSSGNDDDLHLGLGQRCPWWTAVGRRCQGALTD